MMVAGLALGVALGFIIVNNQTAEESSAAAVAPATGLAQDEFIRLNTTDLENLVPASSTAVTQSRAAVDRFIHINTTDLDGLVPAAPAAVIGSQSAVDSYFLHWNIASLEYPTARYTEPTRGPR
jgi:hypothetical protein